MATKKKWKVIVTIEEIMGEENLFTTFVKRKRKVHTKIESDYNIDLITAEVCKKVKEADPKLMRFLQ